MGFYGLCIKKQIALSGEERGNLILFSSLFLTRIPSVRENLEDFIVKTEKLGLQMMMANPQVFANTAGKILKERTPDIDEKGIETVRQLLNSTIEDYNIKVDQDYLVGLTAFPPAEVIDMLMSMRWFFLVAENPYHFITSDAPLRKPEGVASKSFLSFPITSRIALIADWGIDMGIDLEGRYIHINREDVLKINHRTLSAAQKFVVSCEQGFVGDHLLINKTMNGST